MIKLQHVTKSFGGLNALHDLSIHVARGDILAFLGPNGAGKTTTIRMLTTLLKPSNGSILVDGLDAAKYRNEVRKRIGVVFQDPSLDAELTVYENLDLHGVLYGVPRKVRRQRIEQLLRLFDLWERKNEYIRLFSGGTKRRLEVARAFVHTPKVLLLDEPTLGLDAQSRSVLWAHVKKMNENEGVTVFLTTHYMDEAERVAHRVAVIDHGAIVAQGSAAELRQQTSTDNLEAAFLALTSAGSHAENLERHRKIDQTRRAVR